MKSTNDVSILKKALTSYNTAFTQRPADAVPWSATSIFQGVDSVDNPAPPNHIAAGDPGGLDKSYLSLRALKVVGIS
jgi:hypothetical protein